MGSHTQVHHVAFLLSLCASMVGLTQIGSSCWTTIFGFVGSHTHSPCLFSLIASYFHTHLFGTLGTHFGPSRVFKYTHELTHTHRCTLGYSFCWPPILTFSRDPFWHLLQCKGLLVQHKGLMLVQQSPSTQCCVVATQVHKSPSI
jgi:hypothetical protein